MAYIEILTTSGMGSLADDAAFDLTTDAEWRIDFSCADWTPAANQYIVDRYITTGANRNWRLQLLPSSNLNAQMGDSAGAARTPVDNLYPDPGANLRGQMRLTLQADNGATQARFICYSRTGGAITDLEDDTGWTTEETSDIAGVQTWKATTNLIRLGGSSENTVNGHVGMRIYRAIHWSDMTKTTKVFDVTFSDAERVTSTTWNDAARTGNWTILGTETTDWSYTADPVTGSPADVILLETGTPNAIVLEDGTGVLLLEGRTDPFYRTRQAAAHPAVRM